MINIYMYIFIMLVITAISLYIFKDVLSPAFLFCLPWILSFIGLTMSDYLESPTSFMYLYIILGAIIFIIGFGLAMVNTNLGRRYVASAEIYAFKPVMFKLLILFEALITLYLYYIHYVYVRGHYTISIYQSVRQGLANDTLVIPGYLNYARSIIIILAVCMLIMYFNIQEGQKKEYRKILIIQLVLAILNLSLTMTRNGILMSTLPMLISFLICKNFNNRQTLKYAMRFLILFLVFFSVIAIMKVSYLTQYDTYSSLLMNQFALYMSGSLVAFEKLVASSSDYLYGQNTFRFLYAIFHKLFGTGEAQGLVQDTVAISDKQGTNVYTFYQYYFKDFGLLYALLVQFFIGIFHGILYRKMLSKRPINIFFFSIMIYPLVMQFFQDQYISLFSTWLQHLVVGWLFFNSNLFVVRVNNDQKIVRYNQQCELTSMKFSGMENR
ncbi:O-antigen polymerase [Bacillus pacificus]|uniref:O-antigen polymerase n=1 Tax=Bacillus pacificus TaxID=2026187 RepID=UPI002E246A12|nr:O-antigen ligase [Bacillus pacificus]